MIYAAAIEEILNGIKICLNVNFSSIPAEDNKQRYLRN